MTKDDRQFILDAMNQMKSEFNTRMDSFESSVNKRIDEVNVNLKTEIKKVNKRIDEVNNNLKTEINKVNHRIDQHHPQKKGGGGTRKSKLEPRVEKLEERVDGHDEKFKQLKFNNKFQIHYLLHIKKNINLFLKTEFVNNNLIFAN